MYRDLRGKRSRLPVPFEPELRHANARVGALGCQRDEPAIFGRGVVQPAELLEGAGAAFAGVEVVWLFGAHSLEKRERRRAEVTKSGFARHPDVRLVGSRYDAMRARLRKMQLIGSASFPPGASVHDW